ncbi:MAG: hypothetical protein ACRELF_18540 [Gemmataceae bacterium]
MHVSLKMLWNHRRFFGPRRAAARRERQTSPTRRTVRPRLEQLEDRMTPSAMTASVDAGGLGPLQGLLDQVNANINDVFGGASLSQLSSALQFIGARFSAGSPTSMPPPALMSLYIDGASLETTKQGLEHIDYGNAYVLNGLGMGPPLSAEAVQFENALGFWTQAIYQIRGNQSILDVEADVRANLPGTGLLGVLSFLSGVQGVDLAVSQ